MAFNTCLYTWSTVGCPTLNSCHTRWHLSCRCGVVPHFWHNSASLFLWGTQNYGWVDPCECLYAEPGCTDSVVCRTKMVRTLTVFTAVGVAVILWGVTADEEAPVPWNHINLLCFWEVLRITCTFHSKHMNKQLQLHICPLLITPPGPWCFQLPFIRHTLKFWLLSICDTFLWQFYQLSLSTVFLVSCLKVLV